MSYLLLGFQSKVLTIYCVTFHFILNILSLDFILKQNRGAGPLAFTDRRVETPLQEKAGLGFQDLHPMRHKTSRTINVASKGSSHCLSEKMKDSGLSDALRSIHGFPDTLIPVH